MTTPAIKAAEAKLKAALDAVAAAEDALSAKRKAWNAAENELRLARLERDKALPKAIIKTTLFYTGKSQEAEVCIVRKTDKTMFIRGLGEANEKGDQYRLSKQGSWLPYPAPSSWDSNHQELILPDAGIKPN